MLLQPPARIETIFSSLIADTTVKSVTIISVLMGIIALALYTLTLAPTFSWGDSADLSLRIADWHSPDFVGTSRDYVLYRWIGTLFLYIPFGDVGAKTNFMSAFFGALSIGAISFLSGYLANSRIAAIGAGVSFTFSHDLWFNAVMAEVNTFNVFLVIASITAMTVWSRTNKSIYLYTSAFIAGLMLSHHAIGLVLLLPLFVIFVAKLKQVNLAQFILSILVWSVAATLYWSRTIQQFGKGLSLLRISGLAQPGNTFFDVEPLHESIKFIVYTMYNLPGPAIILMFVGLYYVYKKKLFEAAPLFLWSAIIIWAGVKTSVPDKFEIYLLAYPSMAMLIGFGLAMVVEKYSLSSKACAVLVALLVFFPVITYATAAWASHAFKLNLSGAREAPYRDADLYFLWPPKNGDFGPRKYAEEALQSVEPNALLIADYTLWRPLRLVQAVEHQREDVELAYVERLLSGGVDNYINTHINSRAIYLATNNPGRYYQLDRIQARFNISRIGVVYHVLERSPDGSNR